MYPSFPSSRLNLIDTMTKFDIFMMHILEFLGRIILIRNVIKFINMIIKNNTVVFIEKLQILLNVAVKIQLPW